MQTDRILLVVVRESIFGVVFPDFFPVFMRLFILASENEIKCNEVNSKLNSEDNNV